MGANARLPAPCAVEPGVRLEGARVQAGGRRGAAPDPGSSPSQASRGSSSCATLSTGTIAGRPYDLTERPHQRWLQHARRTGVLRTCARLLPRSGPEPRRAIRLVPAAPPRRSGPRCSLRPSCWATRTSGETTRCSRSGSLFNFACAPEDLPVIRPRLFDLLEQTLGYEWTYRISLVEQYARHLAFAEDVRTRLAGSGHPGARHARRPEPDPGSPASTPTSGRGAPTPGPADKPYLSICAIYRDEAPYLREWIEFHRLVGRRAVLPVRQPQRGRSPRGARALPRGRDRDHPAGGPSSTRRSPHTTTACAGIATTRAGSRSSTSTSSSSRPPGSRCRRCSPTTRHGRAWPSPG